MDSLEDFECYDQLLFDPFERRGWQAEEISWHETDVDWDEFDAVIIRSTWDYQKNPQAFFEVLTSISRSSAILENNLDLVRWNLDKTYLRDLSNQQIDIVPSLWKEFFDVQEYAHFFEEFSTDEIIIKPTISANAEDTFRIQRDDSDECAEKLRTIFSNRPFIVQPFLENIITEGEFSLFYFGDTYSHTILKAPKKDDYRVQEEHGGRLQTVAPEEEMLTISEQILELLHPTPLYSRIDLVRNQENKFLLMELELIEPSLYFNMDDESPDRFAEVFNRRMREKMS